MPEGSVIRRTRARGAEHARCWCRTGAQPPGRAYQHLERVDSRSGASLR